MFCHAHADAAAVAQCTACNKLLCPDCRRRDAGRALCPGCFERRALLIRVYPIPPHAPVVERVAPPVAIATPPAMPIAPVPKEPRRPSAALAGALGIVPGLGHLYAGSWLKGFAILGVLLPAAAFGVAAGAIPAAAYAFGHGLVAFDGYRLARIRSGEWSPADVREARGVWIACAAVLALLAVARHEGAPLSLWLAWPALLVPLGVGLALGERANKTDALSEPLPLPETPLKPGETRDQRLKRAERTTGELLNV